MFKPPPTSLCVRHGAAASALVVVCLVACKRPRSNPAESGPIGPTQDPIKLKVIELPVVDVGPPPLIPDRPDDPRDPIVYLDALTDAVGFMRDAWAREASTANSMRLAS